MATALARGFIRAKLVGSGQIIASDPVAAARTAFAKETGAKAANSNGEVVKSATVIFLAVKPDQVAAVLADARFVSPRIVIRGVVVALNRRSESQSCASPRP